MKELPDSERGLFAGWHGEAVPASPRRAMRHSRTWVMAENQTDAAQLFTNMEANTMMIQMRNLWASCSTVMLLATLALPMSAGAFGRSPSESEVLGQPGKMASPASMPGTDGGGGLLASVPEPSSLLLLGIALVVGVAVAIWKRRQQATEQEQAK